ncbi:MAG TPA: coproporphyrinogen-III oxidase family protein [Vicinamibacterales bacterium]|nr:coproporphyrinogen-III oxidase family protein [Vicinamibacterales bacterium]
MGYDRRMSISVTDDRTEVGSYFIANYPPFSVWNQDAVETDVHSALASPPADVPLGLYLHIPFCRKRCHFCYFRVYTDKNAKEVQAYLDTLARECELYAQQPAIAGRPLNFVYFGGGTPSFLSTRQLQSLVTRMDGVIPWREAEEITFECEPGTLTEPKLTALRELGVTRLSLGVENFSDRLLEINGRAHRSPEIGRSYEFARSLQFPQINIDLIAGMLGETDANWRDCVQKTIDLEPDSVTIYQMELPFNTTISKSLRTGEQPLDGDVANWSTKRRWVGEAFEAFERAGYTVASGYAVVKNPATKFVYRDRLWQGADMIGLGVASFGHINGVHLQNIDSFGPYCDELAQGRLPVARGLKPSPEERLIREFVLQMKLGVLRKPYFEDKYGVDVLERFRGPLRKLADEGMLSVTSGRIVLTRKGLLQVDTLLPQFFLPQHQGLRYT